jgi:hypothetical protein
MTDILFVYFKKNCPHEFCYDWLYCVCYMKVTFHFVCEWTNRLGAGDFQGLSLEG